MGMMWGASRNLHMGDLRVPTMSWPGPGELCQRHCQHNPLIWLASMVVTLDKAPPSPGSSFLSSRALAVGRGLTPSPEGPHLPREEPAPSVLPSDHSLGVWKLPPRLTHFEL